MSARSGELAGEALTTFPVTAWVDEAMSGLRGRERVVVPSIGALEVTGPRAALGQALRNLVKNALEASTGRVELVVTEQAQQLVLAVHDDGPGIDEKLVARLGEPFFTTKPVGAGMGLGLFLARTLASQLGGALSIASRAGAGTTVSFSLPRAGAKS
jgi:two-component system sensor histidine kinase RegB